MRELTLKTVPELGKHLTTLKKVSDDFAKVICVVSYEGPVFTVAYARLIFDSGKEMIAEGMARRSSKDAYNKTVAYNISRRRALESLDKKLRRPTHIVGNRFEG